jgi:gliding motility-associated-like protein
MDRKDTIEELFKQKLADHQVSVNPELWTSIASKIPLTTSTVTSTGISLLAKAIIGISAAASVVGLGYLIAIQNATTEKDTIKIQEKTTIKYQPEKTNSNSSNDQSSVPFNNEAVKKESISIVSNTPSVFDSQNLILTTETENNQTEDIGLKTNNTQEIKSSGILSTNALTPTQSSENLESSISGTQNITTKLNEKLTDTETTKVSQLTLVLPNIFTPNGDGNNDVLTLDASAISEFSIVVLNSAGIVVYQSSDSSFSWNGTLPTGDPVGEGNYIYYITGKDTEGKLVSKHSRLVVKH